MILRSLEKHLTAAWILGGLLLFFAALAWLFAVAGQPPAKDQGPFGWIFFYRVVALTIPLFAMAYPFAVSQKYVVKGWLRWAHAPFSALLACLLLLLLLAVAEFLWIRGGGVHRLSLHAALPGGLESLPHPRLEWIAPDSSGRSAEWILPNLDGSVRLLHSAARGRLFGLPGLAWMLLSFALFHASVILLRRRGSLAPRLPGVAIALFVTFALLVALARLQG